MSTHVDKFGLTRNDYLNAIKAGSQAGLKSSDVAEKLSEIAGMEVPTIKISAKISEFRKEVEAAKVSNDVKQKLLAALKLKEGRGRRSGSPEEKLSGLLALLDSDDDNEEVETPENEEVETETDVSENS